MRMYDRFTVEVLQNGAEKDHFHSELEVLYVLEGESELRIKDQCWTLKKDDVVVVNSGVPHSVKDNIKCTVCIVRYDYQVLTEVINQSGCVFLCNSCAEEKKNYDKLRKILKEIIYEEYLYNRKTKSYKFSLFYSLLDELIENHMLQNMHTDPKEYNADEKIQEVIHYIHLHYQDGISLAELAERMYISTSTLSRLFKKQTGIYFAEYVSQIRIKYAINELLYTNKNITKIAMDCGFSNASAFNKIFREKFDCAPTEYRSRMQEGMKAERERRERVREELGAELKEKILPAQEENEENASWVELDVQNAVTCQKIWNKGINIGQFYNLTRANVQYHLLYLVEHLSFSHARMWSVFSQKLMISDGRSIGMYNFDILDSVLDFLVQHHIHPWLDFSRRPDTAVRSAGDSVWFENNAIQFASRRVWESCFRELVKHVLRRYGMEEVENWIFELGEDPFHGSEGPYYEDSEYTYWNVYVFAYDTIKELIPGAKVGGPASIINGDFAYLEELFIRCKKENYIPDFISFYLFPYVPNFEKGKLGEVPYHICPEVDYEPVQVADMKKIMEKTGLGDCDLYISEWNNTVSNRNFINDSCFKGVYICKKILEMWDDVQIVCPWLGTDWVSSYYDSYSVANGGSGLLTKDGIQKPAFFAYDFLNRLEDRVVGKGSNYIVTKSANEDYQILCFNFNWYSTNYFLEPEDEKKPDELDSIMADSQECSIHFTLHNVMDNCEFMVKRRSVNREHGSFLDEWGAFNYETRLDRMDVKYLQDICIPDLGIERMHSVDGSLKFDIKLKKQEFAFYHVFKVED